MDSTLAVQQYIQQLIRKDPSNIDTILTLPDNQDQAAWKYEQLRQFCMELNGLACLLQKQCFPSTCSQMTSTEQWIFLWVFIRCFVMWEFLYRYFSVGVLLIKHPKNAQLLTIRDTHWMVPHVCSIAINTFRVASRSRNHQKGN